MVNSLPVNLSDQQFIPAAPAAVYAALNDTAILQQCIPGCRELQKKGEDEMAATIELKVGPVKATFQGAVTLSNQNPPHGYTISGEGSGGAAGFAKGSAEVKLQPQEGGTNLSYTVEVQISGKIAQLGARLIDSTAKKLAGQFFANLAQCLAPPGDAGADDAKKAPADEEKGTFRQKPHASALLRSNKKITAFWVGLTLALLAAGILVAVL